MFFLESLKRIPGFRVFLETKGKPREYILGLYRDHSTPKQVQGYLLVSLLRTPKKLMNRGFSEGLLTGSVRVYRDLGSRPRGGAVFRLRPWRWASVGLVWRLPNSHPGFGVEELSQGTDNVTRSPQNRNRMTPQNHKPWHRD